MPKKKLYRSRNNRMIAGVCGGLGEYFDIDPTLVRLAAVFLTLWWGGGLLFYLMAWLVIPEAPAQVEVEPAHLLPHDHDPVESKVQQRIEETSETEDYSPKV